MKQGHCAWGKHCTSLDCGECQNGSEFRMDIGIVWEQNRMSNEGG